VKQKTILKLKTAEKISVDLDEIDEIKMTTAQQVELAERIAESQELGPRFFLREKADAHADYLTKILVQRLEATEDVDEFIGDLKYNISELESALAAAVKFEFEIRDQGGAK
tara:strand:+ start:442 stop:777 length:336 start_codon:yes stop_codon:yes gene_type:complete